MDKRYLVVTVEGNGGRGGGEKRKEKKERGEREKPFFRVQGDTGDKKRKERRKVELVSRQGGTGVETGR